MGSPLQLEPLLMLLQSPSKDVVAQIVDEAYGSRNAVVREDLPASLISILQNQLGITDEGEQDLLLQTLIVFMRKCVYESLTLDGIQALFPNDFHPQLRRLLVQIIVKQQQAWREQAIKSQISLPRLESLSWQVFPLGEPSAPPRATVHLKVRDDSMNRMDTTTRHQFQVTRPSLTTMLDSLHKIRDQLDSISSQ